MKFIIASIIIFGGIFTWTIWSIAKTVGDYDRKEEERMRREIYGYPEEDKECSRGGMKDDGRSEEGGA